LRQGTGVRLGEDAADQELSSDEADGGVPARRIRTSVTIRIVARLPEIETSFSNVGQVGNLRRVVNPPTQARLPIARRLTTCPTSKVICYLLLTLTCFAAGEKPVEPAKPEPKSEQRLELNLLGNVDTASGESRRNENVQFNL